VPTIPDLLKAGPTYSFEFYPPRDDDGDRVLARTLDHLMPLNPSFVSVTYGAGGSSRDRTEEIVHDLRKRFGAQVLPHLTCIGHRKSEIEMLLRTYQDEGVTDLLALHGDPPTDGRTLPEGDFRYAVELVEFVRDMTGFSIGVAAHVEGHPMAANRQSDRDHQAAKLKVADFAMTQFFFEARFYIDFMEDMAARGVTTPVIPGVIPVTNPDQTRRMVEMAGGSFPEELGARLESASTPAEGRAIGVEYAATLARELLAAGAPGIHIYPMNRWMATTELYEALGVITPPK
jgi:methylenetetrahydrofolate reductase (NADPH)